MKAPVGVVGAAFALWGWSNSLLVPGLVLGGAYEALGFLPRTRAAEAQVARVMRGCVLAACALLVYTLATRSAPQSIYAWLRWLPVVVWPLLALGQLAPLRPSAFRHALGRSPPAHAEDEPFDASHATLAITLAAAGTGTAAEPWLYAGFALILGWALLARVPRRRLPAATAMLLLAAALGQAIHMGLFALQGRLEQWGTELLDSIVSQRADPFRERTRIGELGRVKLDDSIVMRVTAPESPGVPLLRQATFARYRNGEWSNVLTTARPAAQVNGRWLVADGPAPLRVQVRTSIHGGEGVLALPPETHAIDGLAAESVDVLANGSVLVHGSPRFVSYTAAWSAGGEHDAPEREADLELPATLEPALQRTIAANQLREATPEATAEAVRRYFARDFAYSLELGENPRTLADFMLRDHKGHCEYFASATVLLLRALGIPARYAAGYAVQEFSELEQAYVVRSRHAHAWALAWIDGRWIELDTTPARWAEYEQQAARSFLGPMQDRLSWLADRSLQWWLRPGGSNALLVGALVGVCAATLLLRALWRRRRRSRRARPDAIARAWLQIERRLARLGHRRGDSESVRAWTRRLAAEPGTASWIGQFEAVAAAYYRVRYDPAVPAEDVARFIRASGEWRAG